MSLGLQLPEQRSSGIAKPSSLGKIAPSSGHHVLRWEEGIMREAEGCVKVGRGSGARSLPVGIQRSQSRTFYCCSRLLLADFSACLLEGL